MMVHRVFMMWVILEPNCKADVIVAPTKVNMHNTIFCVVVKKFDRMEQHLHCLSICLFLIARKVSLVDKVV